MPSKGLTGTKTPDRTFMGAVPTVVKPSGPPDLVSSMSGMNPSSCSVERGGKFFMECDGCVLESFQFEAPCPFKETGRDDTWIEFEVPATAPLKTYSFEAEVGKDASEVTLTGSVTVSLMRKS